MSILNLAVYAFVPLPQQAESSLETLREDLRTFCENWSLKGSILLASEGINAFMAGSPESIDAFENHVRALTGLAHLEGKRSWSEQVPFRRLVIKIKPEIIPLGWDAIEESQRPKKALSPSEFHQWLSEGRPFTILDVRNTFEVEIGRFQGTEHLGLTRFRDLADRAREEGLAERTGPFVTVCTGGIRCEKAVPCLESLGVKDVYLLEGGILKYFEEYGSEFYQGNCFVFDERRAVDGELRPLGSKT